MRITLDQVKLALINIANNRDRPHYELSVVRDVYYSIKYEYHHKLKNIVMQEIFTLYAHLYQIENQTKTFNHDEALAKILKIKEFYAGQKILVLKSGVSERTISLIFRKKIRLTPRVWKRISPIVDEVLKDLERHQIEKEKKSHGKYVTYRKGCRCSPCRTAWRIYIQERTLKRAQEKSLTEDFSID